MTAVEYISSSATSVNPRGLRRGMACLAVPQTFQPAYNASKQHTAPSRPAPPPPSTYQPFAPINANTGGEVFGCYSDVISNVTRSNSWSSNELSGESSATSLSSDTNEYGPKDGGHVSRADSPCSVYESETRVEPETQTLASTTSSSTAGQSSSGTVIESHSKARQEDPLLLPAAKISPMQKTNRSQWKGKGKLTLIRDIKWETVNASEVISYCAAYDRAEAAEQKSQHVIMGASPSVETHERTIVPLTRRISPRSRRPPHRRISARPSSSETEQEYAPITAENLELSNAAKRHNQRIAEERAEAIREWSSRLIMNENTLSARLQALRDEVMEAERYRLEQARALQERLAEQDRKAALLLQQELEAAEAEARLEAERRARIKECSVCGELMDKDLFPASRTTSKCEHEGMVCSECLGSWISSALNDNGPEGIKCPECPEKLAYNDVMAVASKEIADEYDKATTLQALSALEDFAWCLASGCKSGQLNFQNSNYMECTLCGYKQCLQHKVQWHAGETCAQYDHRESGAKAREEEAKTLAMLDTMSKVCPGPNCGWRIQKTEGCDHVTCRKCQFQFCWQCLASHLEIKSVGNTAHKKDCKFHSDNLELAWPFNRH